MGGGKERLEQLDLDQAHSLWEAARQIISQAELERSTAMRRALTPEFVGDRRCGGFAAGAVKGIDLALPAGGGHVQKDLDVRRNAHRDQPGLR